MAGFRLEEAVLIKEGMPLLQLWLLKHAESKAILEESYLFFIGGNASSTIMTALTRRANTSLEEAYLFLTGENASSEMLPAAHSGYMVQ